MSAVSCMTWIKSGVAKARPDRVTVDEEDLKRLILNQEARLKSLQISSDEEDSQSSGSEEEDSSVPSVSGKRKKSGKGQIKAKDSKKTFDVDDIVQKYGLDDYDEDSDSEEDEEEDHRLSLAGLAYYPSNKEDPHISKDVGDDDDDEIEITPGDNLIAIGKVDGMFCNLEIHIYNEQEGSLFCHHDVMLPSFPLALEWIGYDPADKTTANLVAMGTMEPDIELWDLDIMDAVEPAFILAGAQKKNRKKKKKISAKGHTDAVLDLSWNNLQEKILASASADFTVGVWDLEKGIMATSITHHTEKVQTIEWHPFEVQTLLSGSFDHTVKVYDCRSADSVHKSWKLSGEVERVVWNHHAPFYFLGSTDTGHVFCMDIRTTKTVFSFEAHSSAVTGLTLSSTIPGCLVTCSSDKILKVWDIRSEKPFSVSKKNLKMEELQCCRSSPDAPLIFAVGGEKELRVINYGKNPAIVKHFNVTLPENAEGGESNEEIRVQDVENDDEEDEDIEVLAKKVNEKPKAPKKSKKKKKKTESK